MIYTGDTPKYEYTHGSVILLFDSMEFEGGTQLSKYTVMKNGLDVAVNGANPPQIILKGRFLRDDFQSVRDYIKDISGTVIANFTINDELFSSMALVKGTVVMDDSPLIGKMIFVFQEVG